MTPEKLRAEEEKREHAYYPLERWQAILNAIAFVEENMPPERRRNRPRWHPGTRFRDMPDGPFLSPPAAHD